MAQPFRFAIPAAFVMWALVAGTAGAAHREGSPAPSSLYFEWHSGWTSGDAMRYGLDPETGDWGFVPGTLDHLALSSVFSEPVVEHRADGSIAVYPDPRYADYLVAHLGPDGKLVFTCTPAAGPRQANAASDAGATPDR